MLYIFCQHESPRVNFIFKLIFTDLLGVTYGLVSNKDKIPEDVPVLNYSSDKMAGGLHIVPSRLLFSVGVEEKPELERINGNQLKLIDEPFFDPFASAFYLVSRYEEYQSFEPDAHRRFPSHSSVLFKTGLLQTPVVNLWALDLNRQLHQMYPDYKSEPRAFEYISTIDVDQAWKYRHKGIRRTIGGFISDMYHRDGYKIKERFRVLSGQRDDPFDNFGYQRDLHHRHGVTPRYFVEVGKRSTYDKNLPASNTRFAALIRTLDKQGVVGMHPSYTSNTDAGELKEEFESLCGVLSRKVTASRQHFLMHRMPETYRRLLDLGIVEDHTMGYSTELGFRAGIAAPFYFYDLLNEEATSLLLIPFCMMDITPLHYYRLSIDEAISAIDELIDTVRQCGGLFVSLWHNESLSDAQQWKGWRGLYEYIVTECSNKS